jgi:peptidoglycan-N-acetylglucosamine deacetylase
MSPQKPRIVTTSWDDGDRADLRVAALLQAGRLPGTFYVPLTGYRGWPTLDAAQLRELAAGGFEIGAHGVTHRTLRGLPAAAIETEVGLSKRTLEQTIGREVAMFCYPRGRYDRRVVERVQAAGYRGARTTRMLATGLRFGAFEMPASLQVFPHTEWTYLRNMAKARQPGRMASYLGRLRGAANWVELGKRLFDRVLAEGGVWHLFGHSWEIEQRGLWAGLEELTRYVSGRPEVRYVSNGALAALAGPGRKGAHNEK